MRGYLRFASIFGSATTFIVVGAILVIALIILVVALFLFRNSGKKKTGAANPAAVGDWQRQRDAGWYDRHQDFPRRRSLAGSVPVVARMVRAHFRWVVWWKAVVRCLANRLIALATLAVGLAAPTDQQVGPTVPRIDQSHRRYRS